MNILFVNNFRGRGGGEEFLRDLLPGLIKKGVKVGLVCRPGTPLQKMFINSEVALYPINRSGLGVVTSVFKIARIIKTGKYRIIDIQRGHDIFQSWIAALLSFKRPTLMYTPQVPQFIKSRFLLNRMDHIVTISRYIKDKIAAFAPRFVDRTTIIHYGIDLNTFTSSAVSSGLLRARFGISANTKIIGTVGDLWKNQIEFLDALVELRKAFPEVRYALVASPDGIGQVEAFKRRARELGLSDTILWTGRLSKAEMLSFYADIDLAVSTHRNEGFGIWILEALAMGRPVVAYKAGGIIDSLSGCPAGKLVDGGPREMAKEIVSILKDSALLTAMSAAGPGWVAKKFSRDRMFNDYHAFFESLLRLGKGYRAIDRTGPLRILQMISKNDRYGAQRIFLDQVDILKKMGNEVIVVARGEQGFVADSVRGLGIPYYGISLKGLRDILFLRRVIKTHAIDVIHTSLDRADYFGLILSWVTGKPVVSTMMVPRCHPGFRFADHVVVLSKKQLDLLKAKRINPDKVSIIRPGIDVDRFAHPDAAKREHWRTKLNTDQYSIVLCHISSMIPRKAHTISIDLVAECKKRGEHPLLIIIGDPLQGEYYDLLVRKIADLGLEQNVAFTGWTMEVPEILSLSHVAVLPSENEALGVVLMEGMAAGAPIIARKGEGGAELIEEYGTGFYYTPEDGGKSVVDNLIALRKDAHQQRLISEQCKRIAHDEFTLRRFGEKLMDIYATVVTKKGR